MDSDIAIASIAQMLGDPTRSKMLLALMGGQALTATELSLEAEVSPSTASAHLAKLERTGLIRRQRQGRHRYFQVADPSVAEIIETLYGVALQGSASGRDASKVQTGPRDPAMRWARVCYDHLAGELAVSLYDGFVEQGWLTLDTSGIALTTQGRRSLVALDLDIASLETARRPICRACLDWSVRRHHLAGGLGAAILAMVYDRGWAEKDLLTRAIHFTPDGERQFRALFPLPTGHPGT